MQGNGVAPRCQESDGRQWGHEPQTFHALSHGLPFLLCGDLAAAIKVRILSVGDTLGALGLLSAVHMWGRSRGFPGRRRSGSSGAQSPCSQTGTASTSPRGAARKSFPLDWHSQQGLRTLGSGQRVTDRSLLSWPLGQTALTTVRGGPGSSRWKGV